MKYKIIGFILVFLIIGGVVLYVQRVNYYKKDGETPQASPVPSVSMSPRGSSPPPEASPEASPGASAAPSPSASPKTEKTLRVEVTETAAGLYESRAKKGTLVHFTIAVMPESRALEFKSGELTTGVIQPGQSKTIEFVLEQTAVFTPSIAQTGAAGPYTITITATE